MVKVFHVLSRDGLVVVSILTRSKKGSSRESKHEIIKIKARYPLVDNKIP